MRKITTIIIAFCLCLGVKAATLTVVQDSSALDPNFHYPEPTIVTAPADTTATEKEEEEGQEGKESGEKEEPQGYTFISNNIRVSADKGEVIDSTFSVKKGGKLSFTATKKIKGIAISATVKEAFTATTDKGQLEALYTDIETFDSPALIVKNVNDTMVTITCNKKMTCYSARVYFYANPNEKIHGRTAPGDTVLFFCKQMIAEYKPYAEYDLLNDTVVVKHNYQIHLSHDNGLDSIYTASINITASEKGKLQGNYAPKNNNFNAEASFCINGGASAVLTKAIDGLASIYANGGDKYLVSGYLIGQDNKFYYFEFNGDAVIIDNTQSISEIESGVAGRSYDLLGRPVSDDYKGIVIRDGKKYMVR